MRPEQKGCKGCRYQDHQGWCDYIGITGRKRPAKIRPGGGCDCKEKKPTHHPGLMLTQKSKKTLSPKTPKKPVLDHGKALDLYHKGANDAQIALACGCSKGTVQHWRNKHQLASNYFKNRKDRGTHDEQCHPSEPAPR